MKHKRISRKALSLVLALVLSLSMIAVGSFTAHAWTAYYLIGDSLKNWTSNQTSTPISNQYRDNTNGKMCTASVHLEKDSYFALYGGQSTTSQLGPVANGTEIKVGIDAIQVQTNANAFKFTGETGDYIVCIDLTNGKEYAPSLWLESATSNVSWAVSGYLANAAGEWQNYTDSNLKFTQESTNVYSTTITTNASKKYFKLVNSDNETYGPSAGDTDVQSYSSSSNAFSEIKKDGSQFIIGTPGEYKIYINTSSPTPKLWVVATSTPTQPTTAQPTTAQPTTAQPTTAQPTTAQPTTVAPTSEPSTTRPGGTVLNNVNIYFKGTTLTYLKPAMTLTDSSGTSTPYTMTKDSYIGTYITGTYKFYWYKATIPTVTVGDSYKITFKTAGSNMEASMNLDFSSCPTDKNMYFGVDNLQIGTKLVDLSNNETAKLCFRSSVNMFTNVAGEPYDPTLTLATVNVSAVSGGETVSYELGDSDMNRSLNILDATKTQMILTYADGINSTEKLLADFNVSGSADIKDVSCLQMYLAKI